MADINATNLTPETLSTLDGTENIVAFDTAEGKKIPLSVLGDYVVQKLTQTLLGQTQTVQNAFTALMGATSLINSTYYTVIPNSSDLDDYKTPGVFGVSSNAAAKSLTNCPVESSFKMVVEDRSTTASASGNYRYKRQTLYHFNSNDVYVRRLSTSNGGSSWNITEWEKVPTRTEINAVTEKLSGLVGISRTDLAMTASSSKVYVVPATSDHILITTGSNSVLHGVWIVTSRSNANLDVTPIITPENVTLTPDTSNFGRFSLTNSFTAGVRVLDICLYGDAITVYTEPSS